MQRGEPLKTTICAIAVMIATQANAEWEAGRVDDKCALLLKYEGKGETELGAIVTPDLDGTKYDLLVTNYNWTPKNGMYGIFYFIDGKSIDVDVVNGSYGLTTGPKKGFMSVVSSSFFDVLAKGKSLTIYSVGVWDEEAGQYEDDGNNATLVDRLSLIGSATAVAKVRECEGEIISELRAAKREREKFSHIPDNPF